VSGVSFFYHMKGNQIGTLRLLDSAGTEAWKLSGEQGNDWKQTASPVTLATPGGFTFEYERGGGFRGDAAVDHVRVDCGTAPTSPPSPPPAPSPSSPPPAAPPSPPPPPGASFDFASSNTPGWTTGGSGKYAFTRTSGGTPSGSTGPSAGVGGTGYYYFAEASSPRRTGDKFTLAYDGSVCASQGMVVSGVSFFYHMKGNQIGTLRLLDSAGTEAWKLSGEQGNDWKQTASPVTLATPGGFTFEYERGRGFRGDAAVTHVTVTCAARAPSAPSPPPPSPASPSPPPPSPPVIGSSPWYPSAVLPVLEIAPGETSIDLEQRCLTVCKNAKAACVGIATEAQCSDTTVGPTACCWFYDAPDEFFALSSPFIGGDTSRKAMFKRASAAGTSISATSDAYRIESLLGDGYDEDDEEEEEEEEEDGSTADDAEDKPMAGGEVGDGGASTPCPNTGGGDGKNEPQSSDGSISVLAAVALAIGCAVAGSVATLLVTACYLTRRSRVAKDSVKQQVGTVVSVATVPTSQIPTAADIEAACEERATSFDKDKAVKAGRV